MKFVFAVPFAFFLMTGMNIHAEETMNIGFEYPEKDTFFLNKFELEGVVVSADKRKSKVMDVPVSVSVLSGLPLENERINSSSDLTGPIPNLYMPDYGSKLTSPVYIRGIGSRINAPSVGFYVDEVALFEKAAFNIDMFDVKRIEVLRGPQGTLYGRNTLGGVVHIITREPGNRFGMRLSAEAGTYGHQQYQLSLNNPIIRDKLYVKVNANYRKRNGFYENQFSGENVDWQDNRSGRLKLIYHPGERSKLILQMHGDLSDEGGYPYAVVQPDEEDLHINYDHESGYNRRMMGASLQYEYSGGWFRLNTISGIQSLKGNQDIDQDFTPAASFFVTQDQDQDLFTQEVRLSNRDEEARFSWITGIYGFYQRNNQHVQVAFGEDGLANMPYESYWYDKFNDMTNYGLAFFGQSSMDRFLVDKMKLTAGLRVDYEKNQLDYIHDKYVNENLTTANDFVSSYDFFEVLPKFSLQYTWTNNQMSYLTLTRGYKSGGFNTTFEREEDRAFHPEYSWNYELGWKSVMYNHKVNIRTALFYIDWKNLQVYQPVPTGQGSMLKNAASAYSRGGEIEITAFPFDNFKITGNYGYSDVKFKQYSSDPLSDEEVFDGNRVPYIPDFTGYTTASYRLPLNDGVFHDLVFSVNLRNTGKIYWNDANEYSQEPYSMMGANISLGIADFNIRVWAENLLDTQYRSFQFTALGNVYAQPGRPRMAGMTLTYEL